MQSLKIHILPMEFRCIESSSMHPSIQIEVTKKSRVFVFTYNESCFQFYMQNLTIGLNRKIFHLVWEIAYNQLENIVDMHISRDVRLNVFFPLE